MADQKTDEGFKVVDRRLFTEAGELRPDAAAQEWREEDPKSKAAKSGSVESHGAPKPSGQSGAAPAVAPEPAPEEHPPSRGFQMLVDFLTRNTAAMLGGMADPRTGQAFVDLEGARELIDMMDALREASRGNLAKSDEDLLLEVIGSLKLTYMEVSKAAAEAMAKKAKGGKG
ncbi:MAG: DUF1844 domain-containing protein [Candidatus Acidiferrales bacterium]